MKASIGIRATYFGSWVLYSATVAYLDWSNSSLPHVLLGLMAFVGALLALLWLVLSGRLSYACVGFSLVLIAVYAIEWTGQINYRYEAGLHQNLIQEVGFQGRMWSAMFLHRWNAGDGVGALAEAYWMFGMALVQLVVVGFMLIANVYTANRARQSAAA